MDFKNCLDYHENSENSQCYLLRVLEADAGTCPWRNVPKLLECTQTVWNLVNAWDGSGNKTVQQLLTLWKACLLQVCSQLPRPLHGPDLDGPRARDGYGTLKAMSDNLDTDLRVYLVDLYLYILPLCLHFVQRQRALGRRLVIGVGGVAAAGKTSWCQVLVYVLTFLLSEEGRPLWGDSEEGGRCAAVLGMDAFHRTNEELTRLGLRRVKVSSKRCCTTLAPPIIRDTPCALGVCGTGGGGGGGSWTTVVPL